MATPMCSYPMINNLNHFIFLSLFSRLKLDQFAWTHKLEALRLINTENMLGFLFYISQRSNRSSIIRDE